MALHPEPPLDRRPSSLQGFGERRFWPAGPGSYTEDDFWLDPAAGLAAVARGLGAIGGQGKPAGKLAVWSLAGEVSPPEGHAARDLSGADRIRRGFVRADVSVQRLSQSWVPGLSKPAATMAALLVEGATAIVAHVGDCRVWRARGDGLRSLTTDHTLGAEWPPEQVPPQAAIALTRMLGVGSEPVVQTIPVEEGDVFLLTTCDVHRALSEQELASALRGTGTDEMIRTLQRRNHFGGRATFVVAKVGPAGHRTASRGSSTAPGLRWLYAPASPLDDAPDPWGPGSTDRGPDARWFSEVFGGVMGEDA